MRYKFYNHYINQYIDIVAVDGFSAWNIFESMPIYAKCPLVQASKGNGWSISHYCDCGKESGMYVFCSQSCYKAKLKEFIC